MHELRRLAPAIGVTRVARLTSLDRIGIETVTAVRPAGRALSVQQGKGLDFPHAVVSGLMECVELDAAEAHAADGPTASARELAAAGLRAVDLGLLPRCGDRGPADPERRMRWTWARSLPDGERWLVPHALVHADFAADPPWAGDGMPRTTTGLGAAPTLREAVLHGLLEVVERDALTLWAYAGERAGAVDEVDLGTVDDPTCRRWLDRIATAGVEARAWEITAEHGVPAFLVALAGRGLADVGPAAAGSAARLKRSAAFLAALAEAAQSRLTFIAGARDSLDDGTYHAPGATWWDGGGSARRPWTGTAHVGGRAAAEDPLGAVVARLDGFRILYIDLTRPEIGIPAVRVLVPGLEDGVDTPGYRPGARLRRRLAANALRRLAER